MDEVSIYNHFKVEKTKNHIGEDDKIGLKKEEI